MWSVEREGKDNPQQNQKTKITGQKQSSSSNDFGTTAHCRNEFFFFNKL
jgi:hypothetical protein